MGGRGAAGAQAVGFVCLARCNLALSGTVGAKGAQIRRIVRNGSRMA